MKKMFSAWMAVVFVGGLFLVSGSLSSVAQAQVRILKKVKAKGVILKGKRLNIRKGNRIVVKTKPRVFVKKKITGKRLNIRKGNRVFFKGKRVIKRKIRPIGRKVFRPLKKTHKLKPSIKNKVKIRP